MKPTKKAHHDASSIETPGAAPQVKFDLRLHWARIAMAESAPAAQFQISCAALSFFNDSHNQKRRATGLKKQINSSIFSALEACNFLRPPDPQVAGSRRRVMVLAASPRATVDFCGAARRSSGCSCVSPSLLPAPLAAFLREAPRTS